MFPRCSLPSSMTHSNFDLKIGGTCPCIEFPALELCPSTVDELHEIDVCHWAI